MTVKRLAAPRFWAIPRKTAKYIPTPRPGPFSLHTGLPLTVVLRDNLKLAATLRELRTILLAGHVRVNGVVRKDPRYTMGSMDILSVDNVNYILFPTRKGLSLFFIPSSEKKLALVTNKHVLSGGRVQLSLHDGSTMLAEKKVKTRDVLVLSLPDKTIDSVIGCAEGSLAVVMSGKNRGKTGTIKTFVDARSALMTIDGKDVPVPRQSLFVLGTGTSVIPLGDKV